MKNGLVGLRLLRCFSAGLGLLSLLGILDPWPLARAALALGDCLV
jgi:hypothetical protein